MKRISILLVSLLALVVVACSSDQGASPSASEAAGTAEATTAPSSAAAEPTDALPSGSAMAIPSFDLNGDPELAGRFPDTVGGQPLEVQSFRGDTFASFGGADPSFEAFLDSIGAEMEDVSVAFGGAMAGESALTVGAFRVLGASEEELEREFIAASEEAGDVSGATRTTISGKDVWTASDPTGESGLTVFIYTKDDTLYFLTGAEEQAAEILEALP